MQTIKLSFTLECGPDTKPTIKPVSSAGNVTLYCGVKCVADGFEPVTMTITHDQFMELCRKAIQQRIDKKCDAFHKKMSKGHV